MHICHSLCGLFAPYALAVEDLGLKVCDLRKLLAVKFTEGIVHLTMKMLLFIHRNVTPNLTAVILIIEQIWWTISGMCTMTVCSDLVCQASRSQWKRFLCALSQVHMIVFCKKQKEMKVVIFTIRIISHNSIFF